MQDIEGIEDLDGRTGRTGPLSYGQKALWFLQQLSPDNCAYNIAIAARLTGSLDAAVLKRSFQCLVDRHSALRTTFPSIRGKPLQFVPEHQHVCFTQLDASTTAQTGLMKQLSEEVQKPFDLEAGPVLRVSLFKLSAAESVLLLAVHHIAVDYSSVQQCMKELGVIYSAALAGNAAALPTVPVTYIDYAKWQNEMLAGPDGERMWSYWSEQLSGDLPAIHLPFDRPRRQMQTFRGDTYRIDFDGQLTSELRRLAEQLNGSLFTVLLAAFFFMLHQLTGQNDILAGSPPIGHRQSRFDGVVGFFHNPIVFRSIARPGQSFADFHEHIKWTVRDALEHRDYPFSYLVEKLKPSRHPSYSPLFQVMFVFYDRDDNPGMDAPATPGSTQRNRQLTLPGVDVEFLEIEEPVSMLDITLTIEDEGHSLTAAFQYNTDLFDLQTIESIANRLIDICERVAFDSGLGAERVARRPESSEGLAEAAEVDEAAEAQDQVRHRAQIRRERMKRQRRQRTASIES